MVVTDADTIHLITANLDHDGGPDDTSETWRIFHEEVLAPRKPDGVFRQEMAYSTRDNNKRLEHAARILGGETKDMRGWITPSEHGDNPTGIFLRTTTFPTAHQHGPRPWWINPPTRLTTHLAEVPEVPIELVSWHLSFCSRRAREQQAEDLSSIVDKVKQGHAFLGAGDCNECPLPEGEVVPPIDWSSTDITDLAHRRHRAIKQPDGTWASCTYLDELMLDCGMHDPARYAAHHNGNYDEAGPLAATAGHAPQAKGQGGESRIDRWYLDPWLVTAVEDVRVIDTTGLTDHKAVELVLSRKGMVAALSRQVAPEPHFFSTGA